MLLYNRDCSSQSHFIFGKIIMYIIYIAIPLYNYINVLAVSASRKAELRTEYWAWSVACRVPFVFGSGRWHRYRSARYTLFTHSPRIFMLTLIVESIYGELVTRDRWNWTESLSRLNRTNLTAKALFICMLLIDHYSQQRIADPSQICNC